MKTCQYRPLALLGALVLALSGLYATAAPAGAQERSLWIVELEDPPLASYRGGIAGLAPTNPAARGETRLDVDSAASRAYLSYLEGRHRMLLTAAGAALGRSLEAVHDYRYAYNGMALELTRAEAAVVRGLPGVAQVQPAVRRRLLTDAGPAWIGAPAIWSGRATGGRPGTMGEGVVVGVIDTGINHDHPSFADVGGDGYDHENPRGTFYGLCDPVTGAPFCNDKLIGVWDFTGSGPQDDHGHGSHTASTAAGNVLQATVHAPTLELTREISGVAPHANLITYKACLPTGSCLSPSLVAAIDQATADGVDVINYSIGGSSTDPWTDADAQAFLGARDAGVFVAASAGNSGPGPETVGSPADAPWVTAVGASTHNRAFVNSIGDLSGGASEPPPDLVGKSFTSGYGPAPVVYAGDYGDNLCSAPFPPGTFDGEIVICDRGVNPRVEKGRNVKIGGAGGMVLANSEADGDSTVADPHELPAVNISYEDGVRLKQWVAEGEGHTGTIAGTSADESRDNGDVMASFSSRGPNKSVPGVLKPDVTAPGVDILAAVHTTNPAAPPEYGLMSGTSMSSPHLAGAAALVRALHPEWTPAEVQSALTSTGFERRVRKEDGETRADPFDMGGGRVALTKAARAGLVLDEVRADYEAANPATGGDPTALNLATLASADCVATCSWVRTVENALDRRATWKLSARGSNGLLLSVKPQVVRLGPGESADITVTADVSQIGGGGWVFGRVQIQAGPRRVVDQHLPVAVLPGGTPVEVDIEASDTTGSHTVEMQAPLDITDLTARVYGLEKGVLTERMLEQDPTPLDPYDGVAGTFHITTEVPEGARSLAAEIARTTSSDLDLFVGIDTNGDGQPSAAEEVCRSASETAMESCKLQSPEAGTYWIMVQNWLSGQVVDEVELVAATVPGTDEGNLEVTGPASVPRGETYELTLSWDEPDMEPGTIWFGLVQLSADGDDPPGNAGSLLVTVNRPEG